MKLQRGQTLVEFALILPFMALFIFGMIYGGAMFMEYLNFSNDARQIAREVSVLANADDRENIIESYSDEKTAGEKNFSRFYKVKRKIYFTYEQQEKKDAAGNVVKDPKTDETVYEDNTNNPIDVVVEVTFQRDNTDLPWVLYTIGFPPKEINPIVYRMRLEKKPSNEN